MFKPDLSNKKFSWRTENSYIRVIEKKLLKQVFDDFQGDRILEVGCGEGTNLFHLKKYFNDITGLDILEEGLQLASEKLPQVKFLNCGAKKLPFNDEVFDIVFIRDVLHHLAGYNEKIMALKEMRRVCREGGRILIIEPNGRNLISFLQMVFQKEERGIKTSTANNIKKLLSESNLNKFKIEYAEPLPTDRLIMHYRFGFPWLGYIPVSRFFLRLFNLLFKIIIPKRLWSYMIYKVQK